MFEHQIYLISGKQRFFLEKKIKKLINYFQNKSFDVVYYQMKKDLYIDLEKELKIVSLFRKIIIVDQSEILLQRKKEELTFLNYYLKNPSQEIFLYFFAEKQPYNTETYQIFKQYCFCETIAFLEKKDFFTYILTSFEKEGFQIEKKAIWNLLKDTNYNLFFLSQEIKKLKLCQFENKNITYQLVEKLSIFKKKDNIFTLIDFFLNNNKIAAYKLYQKLKAQKNNNFQILYQLINKIKDLLLVKDMIKENYNQEKISQILKCSSSKTFFLNKEVQTIKSTPQSLKKHFLTLIELEYQAKIGAINLNIGLELFFLGKNNIFNTEIVL
ncbi:DNA polymerase III delta subunit [Candidatus Phytoplasma solani]|uniref:DNA polymerase III subunit delta n=1 Tax=Candidatus Phytoplasma solani TaxID=69896 RepID=UPI0032DBA902